MNSKFTLLAISTLTFLAACTSNPPVADNVAQRFFQSRSPSSMSEPEYEYTCVDEKNEVELVVNFRDQDHPSVDLKKFGSAYPESRLKAQSYPVKLSFTGLQDKAFIYTSYNVLRDDSFFVQISYRQGQPATELKPALLSVRDSNQMKAPDKKLFCCNEDFVPKLQNGRGLCEQKPDPKSQLNQ